MLKIHFKIYVQDSIQDPFFNLAAEEYLLKKRNENGGNYLFIYRNSDSIVCGKNQSIWSEANLKYCRENNIQIAKRVSGGGTVYHDLGNLNFCFITERKSEWVSNFQVFNAPVISFLNELGIKAYNNERNDILIDGFKISGNAQHLFSQSLISHATLLYDANLQKVSVALKHQFDNVESKAIDSKRVKVTNINQHGIDAPIEYFQELFIENFENHFKVKRNKGFDQKTIQEIEYIRSSKYIKQDWIYGKSPQTKIESSGEVEGHKFKFNILLEKGIVKSCIINSSDQFEKDLIVDFLSGEYFNHQELSSKLDQYNDQELTTLSGFLNSLPI